MKPGLTALLLAGALAAAEMYPVARFTDPQRREKLSKAFPEIDGILKRYMEERGAPGLVYGIVIDGELAHLNAFGVRDRSSGAPVTPKTVFRIASMTKSFTALALLKLRDEGKLSLDDPVSKWIPEFGKLQYPTRDTAPIRVRQLVTHGTGLPEDNPWGDQQLAAPENLVDAWLRKGFPFSTAPDTAYEYSNYGFALAGRVISKAAKRPYREYMEKEILAPLGMTASTLEPGAVPAERRAIGYRRLPDGTYEPEPPLAHGAFGAMGGMLTSAEDMGKYVGFMLSAWPPRDDAEGGPVRRSSVREMQRVWRTSGLSVEHTGSLQARAAGYGYGLAVVQDCRFRSVAHGGGLPGYGSYMMWLPEYGVGLFAMANLTYSGPSSALSQAFDALRKTGGLEPRRVPASPVLVSARDAIFDLWKNWTEERAEALAADNLFKDIPKEQRRRQMEQVKKTAGECRSAGEVRAENWLRGSFRLLCANGEVEVSFTLAPTNPPLIQFLQFRPALELTEVMKKAAAGHAAKHEDEYGACEIAGVAFNDGRRSAGVLLDCERGQPMLQLDMGGDGAVKGATIRKRPDAVCGP